MVGFDLNRVIGKNGKLPWDIPEYLARFKKITTGYPVIMGKTTWKSIGKALPGRQNIVISKDVSLQLEGAIVVHSIEEALKLVDGQEAFVIGGAQIYKQFLPLADKLFITMVHSKFDGDTFFPPYNEDEWLLKEKKDIISSTGYPLSFLTYTRKDHFQSEKVNSGKVEK
ncbi:MAG TPA: dihydrofolate reductase [Candidatus Cloacimonas sp.]|nr:dihydrofolate reductase [Candidatus Cloacimonas sp.]